MATTTLLSLDQDLLELIGDWKQHAVTTALAANTATVSTHLQNYRSTVDVFNDYWIYMEDQVNAGEERKVADDDGTDTLSALTAWAANTTGTDETFRLSRFSFTNRKLALNQSIKQIYPAFHNVLENRTLITNNHIPNFEDWASSTQPDKWTAPTGTVAANTTVTYLRGSSKSAKLTAGAANDYFYIDSNDWPELLDLMDKTVTAKVWAYPAGTADNASIEIYTEQADGTAQSTLISTTACPADAHTLLELEDQELNDDLVKVQIRLKVASSTGVVYFNRPRITGPAIYEYRLPTDFYRGHISSVEVQSSSYSDDPCDDILPTFDLLWGTEIIDDGTDKFLRLPHLYTSPRQIRLKGDKPLSSLSAATSTINIDDRYLEPLLEYAAYRLYTIEKQGAASEDRSRYDTLANEHLRNYYRLLPTHRMPRPSIQMKVRMTD